MTSELERAAERLAVALDVPDLDAAARLAQALSGRAGTFKVGLELFAQFGPRAVETANRHGAAVFLDLKLHDIPRTVAAAVSSAGALGARYLTLHALGGPAMISAAREAADRLGATQPRLLAVTILTSHSDQELELIGLSGGARQHVLRLAQLSLAAGADGVVCSPQEIASLRQALGAEALIVTPGVRPVGADKGDQVRVATPAEAIRDGASLLVIGRPIVAAPDPRIATEQILAEIAQAL
jgi:orotidine-5'-phosphate decarboxylase